tara:strand:- start:59795 stop:60334 length:540 start_codon:yes stop_codon:yes gene_type:complete
MKLKHLVLCLVLVLVSCKEQEGRKPITASKSFTLASTAKQLKQINKFEEGKILQYIKNDSISQYQSSATGYWYQYIKKVEENTAKPKMNDVVEISYEILDLNNNIIYSKEALGIKKYKIDKEDFIPALQQGIKTMKKGETIKFVIPSHNAFGFVGDGNKIGVNQSIISLVTLININEDI